MSDTPPSSDSPTPIQTPSAPPSRKGCMIAFAVSFLLLVGFVGFVLWAGRERMHSQSSVRLRKMDSALNAYYEKHGSFPPMVPMKDVVSDSDQARILAETHVFTAELGDEPVPRDMLSGLPVAFYTDGKGYLIYIPGRDGDYDITDPEKIFDSELGENNPRLAQLTQPDFKATDGDRVRAYDRYHLPFRRAYRNSTE